MRVLIARLVTISFLTFGMWANVSAALIVDIYQSGADLQATLSGSLNLSATQGFSDQPNSYNGFLPNAGLVAFNSGRVNSYRLNITSFAPFGTSFSVYGWGSSSGDLFAMYGGGFLAVPLDYQSGAELSATATRIGYSISNLSTGSFVSTFSNGQVSDSITVRVGLRPSAVPLPSTLLLFILGFLGLFIRKLKQHTYTSFSTVAHHSQKAV